MVWETVASGSGPQSTLAPAFAVWIFGEPFLRKTNLDSLDVSVWATPTWDPTTTQKGVTSSKTKTHLAPFLVDSL